LQSIEQDPATSDRAVVDTAQPFQHIGGYHNIKAALNRLVIGQFSDPDSAVRLGVQPTSGILLSGPPGCGKTLFAMSLATVLRTYGVQFFSVKPTEIFSKYLGDSEKTLRVCIDYMIHWVAQVLLLTDHSKPRRLSSAKLEKKVHLCCLSTKSTRW